MTPRTTLAALASAVLIATTACSGADTAAVSVADEATTAALTTTDTETTETDSETETTETDTESDSTDTAATTDADTTDATDAVGPGGDDGPGGGGGPGGATSADTVSTVAELVDLIDSAYGDASLGLHRGHQPVESVLIEFLGISHDEMHVRMEQHGQNLEAIATDLGLDHTDLIEALVESWSPAIDTLLAAGEISDDEAEAYRDALTEAFTYRVTWNGSDATPTFSGLA